MKTIKPDGVNLKGRRILIKREHLNPGFTQEQAIFVCEDGFGCFPKCSGKSIFGHFENEVSTIRIERPMVDSVIEEDISSRLASGERMEDIEMDVGHAENNP